MYQSCEEPSINTVSIGIGIGDIDNELWYIAHLNSLQGYQILKAAIFFTMLGGSSASWPFFVVWLVAFVDISVVANLAVAGWSIASVETDMSLVKAGKFKVLKIEQEMRRKCNENEPPPTQ